MKKELAVVVVLVGVAIALVGAFLIGEGVADESVVLGDVSGLAECLGVEPRAGVYHVSDILRALARLAGNDCVCPFEIWSVDRATGEIVLLNTTSVPQDPFGWSVSDGEGSYTIEISHLYDPGTGIPVYIELYNPKRDPRGLLLEDHDEVYLRNPAGDLCDKTSW